jgi:hypothetical protein
VFYYRIEYLTLLPTHQVRRCPRVLIVDYRHRAREQAKYPKMPSASQHIDLTAGDAGGSASDHLQLLQRLEMFELQAGLDAQNIAQLQEQNTRLEGALDLERARGEKHAEALMRIARTCDDRVDELKSQHAGAIAKLENENATSKAASAAAFAKFEEEKATLIAANAALQAHVAVLQAQTTSKLTDIHAAIAALHMLLPPPPPLLQLASMAFDRDWCTAACGPEGKVDIDAATGMRAHVIEAGKGWLTLRSAAPLSRRPAPALTADGRQQHRLPGYRVVVEKYSPHEVCHLGFVPSHCLPIDAVTSSTRREICNHGGWYIRVDTSSGGLVPDAKISGWMVLEPLRSAGDDAAEHDASAYATTSKVPPVPAGSAVEFAVDYAAGTCHVAFYTREAVAGGFVGPPCAKMELRFVANEAMVPYNIPARSVPTAADSHVELYPVVGTPLAGTIWRFVS